MELGSTGRKPANAICSHCAPFDTCHAAISSSVRLTTVATASNSTKPRNKPNTAPNNGRAC